MSTSRAFEYDIAFSCLAGDAQVARRLEGLLRGRFKTLVSTNHDRADDISGLARLVVVLHRGDWGLAGRTRAEEIAIRNRAHDEGYDFTLLISLDGAAAPKWLPRFRVWNGLERWGVSGVAAVMEARLQDLGVEARTNNLEFRETPAPLGQDIQQQFSFSAA
jgi:hypothetical protein